MFKSTNKNWGGCALMSVFILIMLSLNCYRESTLKSQGASMGKASETEAADQVSILEQPAKYLRLVELEFVDGSAARHIVSAGETAPLIFASVKLHNYPGINPHNNQQTLGLKRIVIYEIGQSGPFWWSTPDLQNNGDQNGAQILDWKFSHVAWEKDKGYLEEFYW